MLNNLTAEQKNILQNMLPALGLASDIARAKLTVFLPDSDKKFFNIYKQIRPLTLLGEAGADMTGQRVRCLEEPLVARAMQQNIPVTGKREWKLGIFSSFRVFPLRDGFGKCFGALSFDTDDPDEIMLRTALDFLMSVPVGSVRQYERLSPEDGLMVVDAQKVIIAVIIRHAIFFRCCMLLMF